MDLFSRYYGGVGGMTPTEIIGVEKGFHATPRKIAYGKSSKTLSVIQRSDQKLWTFFSHYCGCVGGTTRTDIVGV
jgi:hypothetical protein